MPSWDVRHTFEPVPTTCTDDAGALCRALIPVVDRCAVVAESSREVSDQIRKHRARLSEPLRIALSGVVSAGKSTLLNALVERVIAPTGAAETTRLVTWYHGGDVENAEIRLRNGSVKQLYLTENGEIPDELGVAVEEIDSLHVTLPTSALLRRVTLVDTPGLFSVRDENSERTREALSPEDADSPDVDALLFLLNGQQSEIDTLDAFLTATAGIRTQAANVIGVLSKIDQGGDEMSPLEFGRRKADRLSEEPQLKMKVAEIIPVIGLIAETVCGNRLRNRDMEAIARLAAEDYHDVLLQSADLLVLSEESPSGTSREQLLKILGLHGVRAAVHLVVEGCDDIEELKSGLLATSGYAELEQAVWRNFVPRTDAVKADQVIGALHRLSFQLPGPQARLIREELEAFEMEPFAHALRELWAVRIAATEGCVLPDWLARELLIVTNSGTARERLGLGPEATDSDVLGAALSAERRLQRYAARPLVPQHAAAVAEVLRTSYGFIVAAYDEGPRLPGSPASVEHRSG
jgi:dynamin family protein